MQIKINTPKVRSDEAMGRIMHMLQWMERIGRLQHGVAIPMGADGSKLKEGDRLWQPWTSEERNYFKGVRNMFAHGRCSVLTNGAVRVRDKSPRRFGKPELHGLEFDKETTDWEWTAHEFLEFSQRLETLVLQRLQCYFITTVTCQTCGQSVDARDRLTCGHVEYLEGSNGDGMSKPRKGTLNITATLGYDDEMKDNFPDPGMKAVITHDGFDWCRLLVVYGYDSIPCATVTEVLRAPKIGAYKGWGTPMPPVALI